MTPRRYEGRRDFRAGAVARWASVLVTALFVTGAVFTHSIRGWTWDPLTFAVMTVVGVGAIVESLVIRVRLTDDALIATDLLGSRSYRAAEIVGVEESKGAPTAIRLAGGRWVKLPPVGSSLGNSIRAWLKQFANPDSEKE